ncbi:hypothetical protein [Streptomyces tauricus]|uniref:hypothetical protein n=1 Tax=Streptomyces tauricus TaxID=68274 RepID=UPI0022436442|nr:hypothetical protein [Streptomyces tauricus]MCW8103379.1 hypothetical protein [Streptomyces tauricus]
MDEGSLESRAEYEELPPADAASSRDLAQALRALGAFSSELERPGCSEELEAEHYRRIRRLADWICAAATTRVAQDRDFSDALEAWGDLEPGELSHAMLIAILMSNSGSHVIPPSAMTADALAGRDGALHAAALEQLPGGYLRISVCPRPDTDHAGTDLDRT